MIEILVWIGENHSLTAMVPFLLALLAIILSGAFDRVRALLMAFSFCFGVACVSLYLEEREPGNRALVAVHGAALLVGCYFLLPWMGWRLWKQRSLTG